MAGHERGFIAVNNEEIDDDNENATSEDSKDASANQMKESNKLTTTIILIGCIVLSLCASTIYIHQVDLHKNSSNSTTEHIQCHSLSVHQKSLISQNNQTFIPDGYKLLQTTIHMRHFDRWMYSHYLINNNCWTNQLNSSNHKMKEQFDYNLSSTWQQFTFENDPYAQPFKGSCEAKQLTTQGIEHARLFGRILYQHLTSNNAVANSNDDKRGKLCNVGTIKLESDVEQKNQLTTQHVYYGLCGTFPNVTEHTYESVINDGTIAKKRPFFLQTSICHSEYYNAMLSEAHEAFYKDKDTLNELKETASKLANMTGKAVPNRIQDLTTFLDNIEDCVVCHECHKLHDTPMGIWNIFHKIDELETLSRLYPFDYYQNKTNGAAAGGPLSYPQKGHEEEETINNNNNQSKVYKRFISNYYGYYFVTILHRMKQAIQYGQQQKNKPKANGNDYPLSPLPTPPLLYLQVTSDSILSPQLRILNAPPKFYTKRPVWGSQIVYQLLEQKDEYFVRILYEGEVLWNVTQLQEFEKFVVEGIMPSKEDCGIFYDNFGMD